MGTNSDLARLILNLDKA
jgi:hypothetical protein